MINIKSGSVLYRMVTFFSILTRSVSVHVCVSPLPLWLPRSESYLWPPSVASSALLLSASPEDDSASLIPTQNELSGRELIVPYSSQPGRKNRQRDC